MFVVLGLVGCLNNVEREQIVAEEQVIETMGEHWTEAEQMREAVIAGDLDQVHALAASFQGRMPIAGLPADLAPLATALKSSIDAAAASTDPSAAGLAVGQMAAACGTCHTVAKVQPDLTIQLRPSKTQDPAPEMVWHHVATGNLWASIVRHDDAQFREAVDQLAKAKFQPMGGSTLGDEMVALEGKVQGLAAEARDEAGLEGRGEKLGRILGSCATCHQTVGVTLK